LCSTEAGGDGGEVRGDDGVDLEGGVRCAGETAEEEVDSFGEGGADMGKGGDEFGDNGVVRVWVGEKGHERVRYGFIRLWTFFTFALTVACLCGIWRCSGWFIWGRFGGDHRHEGEVKGEVNAALDVLEGVIKQGAHVWSAVD
jgi:hypothetical protein